MEVDIKDRKRQLKTFASGKINQKNSASRRVRQSEPLPLAHDRLTILIDSLEVNFFNQDKIYINKRPLI